MFAVSPNSRSKDKYALCSITVSSTSEPVVRWSLAATPPPTPATTSAGPHPPSSGKTQNNASATTRRAPQIQSG